MNSLKNIKFQNLTKFEKITKKNYFSCVNFSCSIGMGFCSVCISDSLGNAASHTRNPFSFTHDLRSSIFKSFGN